MVPAVCSAPTFVDDVILGDEDYKPSINSDVFNAIKEERKVVGETDGGTKSFDKFENISSSKSMGDTMPVESLKDIPKMEEEKQTQIVSSSQNVISEAEIDDILTQIEEEDV